MYTLIDETIEVFVQFKKGTLAPLCFSWRNKDYEISTINFRHTSKKGNILLWHFSVTSQSNTYKLTFDPINCLWILDEVFLENNYSTQSINDKSDNQY